MSIFCLLYYIAHKTEEKINLFTIIQTFAVVIGIVKNLLILTFLTEYFYCSFETKFHNFHSFIVVCLYFHKIYIINFKNNIFDE